MADHHHPDLFREGIDWQLIATIVTIVGAIVGLLVWMATGGVGPAMADVAVLILRVAGIVVMVVGFVAAPILLLAAIITAVCGLVALFVDGPEGWLMKWALWLFIAAVVAVVVAFSAALLFVVLTGYVPDLPHGRWK